MSRNERDAHHTLFERKSWELRPESYVLRENDSLIAHNLARTAHNLLHKMNSPVPVPGYHTLVRVSNRMPRGLDVESGIDTFCKLVDDSNKHPSIKPLEIKLNELCIESLRAQLPYIQDGLPSKRGIIT